MRQLLTRPALLAACWFTLSAISISAAPDTLAHYIWIEAEHFAPLRGGNFSFEQPAKTAKGSWAVAGPGVAAEWTQGGESEWMSIAARADETNTIVVSHEVEVPAAGAYVLWVRYADYRRKKEEFAIRIQQGDRTVERSFGGAAVVDELEPMKMLWDWSFGWGQARVPLNKGGARVELVVRGPSEARRQVDCLCLTTDLHYNPVGREKPDFAPWRVMRQLRTNNVPSFDRPRSFTVPAEWKISSGPPVFVWNIQQEWLEEIARPAGSNRVDDPFGVDPPLTRDFLAAFRGKELPVYGDPLSGPASSISRYPVLFTNGSPFMRWLDRHPDRAFALVLNYSEPEWRGITNRAAVQENLRRHDKQFVGYIAGESIAHTGTDGGQMEKRVRAATTRQEIYDALRDMHDASVIRKFTNYYGGPVTSAEAWEHVISCLSGNMESYAHLLGSLGCRRIGHENTGNSPTLARRLAFLRGAARQFGCRFFDYQSANLGDSATMFSRQNYIYAASAKYILDNSYDAWAGAGHHWLLKDYLLWHVAGVDGFYNEQGIDIFWKPGGIVAGDEFPVQLSPKGRTAEFVQQLARKHPRGTQFTPIAFLLDQAHGWSQERFKPAAFQLDPELNPPLLRPGPHEASIRGWFDLAYFPAPETQNEPASGIRQTFVNGMFGDIFDVIVTAPGRTRIVPTYQAVIAAGELVLSDEWGRALRQFMERGGTFVACAGQLGGPGTRALGLPELGELHEANSFKWMASEREFPAQAFRYASMQNDGARTLATVGDAPLAQSKAIGKGRLITVAVPLGLGLDERPVAVLGLILNELAGPATPLHVGGDVEWVLNKLDGGWLITLFNNRGVIKPQHGILPTDAREEQAVTLRLPFEVGRSEEWVTETSVTWRQAAGGTVTTLKIPAGAVRLIAVYPRP